ncbi:PKD domain-containing protein [Actinophytocola sp.]|uniref:PKD domain-containing protein n=1 Tax=Actinophytocola sp. TaxID=1872138 RepID=UPI002ED8F670
MATFALAGTTAARADSAPPVPSAADPMTVSADGLPTVQINGVGWAQAVVGNTVYVGGVFSTARPAGAAAGTQETPRSNMLAYDIRTGELITSFDPVVNGQILAVTASPDGSRLYIGGDFTDVDGQTRNRVAAIDTASGELVAGWAPFVNSQVRAIAATNDTVYLGGSISAVGGVSRSRLAAVTASNAGLLPWAPVPGVGPTSGNRDGSTVTSDQVLGMVLTSGGTQVVVSGRFDSLNGVKATGVGALDAVTGVTRPYEINQLITNQGINAAVYSLSTDGTVVVGTGYDFSGPGNLEGSFTVVADTGRVLAINDCHGDHYGSFVTGGVVYIAGHAHDCSNIGGFKEQNPRVNKYATAISVAPTGTVGPFTLRSNAFYGKPAPSLLNWFPTMNAGTITGQTQAGWSITGNSQYITYAGEFPRVNGVDQQGLVRYAMPGTAPNLIGPSFAEFTTSAVETTPGSVRVSWRATTDQDNKFLTYRVYKDNDATTPVHEVVQGSDFSDRPLMTWTDPGTAGTTYRVTATDPFGNRSSTPWAAVSTTAVPTRPYAEAVLADGVTELWSLGEPAGAAAALGQRNLAVLMPGTGVTAGVPGALVGDADTAYSFDGTSAASMVLGFDTGPGGIVPFPFQAPESTTGEVWMKTTSTQPGELIGFGTAPSGDSPLTDRTVTMGADGRLSFAVNVDATTTRTVTSAASYNDGAWHHVSATYSPSGVVLYVDGAVVASHLDVPANLTINGYLRVGGDAGNYFEGSLDEPALYILAPQPGQVMQHYRLGSGAAGNTAPTATFTATTTPLTVALDATSSADPDGTVASYTWTFGDGATGTGPTVSHPYAAAGTYPVTVTVTDDDGATDSHAALVVVSAANVPPTAAFTSSTAGRTLSVAGTGSADSDGTVASYSWNWGDGTPAGSGATATHPYAADGTYTVTLTVTDDQGATGTLSQVVTVAAGPAVIVDDNFSRTVTGGLGTAPVGGPWTASVGGTRQSVAPGIATMQLPAAGNNTGSFLGNVSQTTSDVRTTFSLSAAPTGNGTYVYVTGRRVSATLEYRVRVRLLANGTVGLALSRVSGGTEAFPGGETIVPGLTLTAGAPLNVRVLMAGTSPTQVQVWAWRGGTAEPTAASITRTDTTAALQVPGSVGLSVHRPTGTTAVTNVRFTSYRVTGPGGGTPPVNAPPTASFTATASGMGVSVNGSASTDAEGPIVSYAWNWGDGGPVTTGTAATATHTYTVAGPYTVTLTVTDSGGLTGTTTRPVTVAATPPANVVPTASFTATPTALQVAVDAAASTDSDGTIASYAWN